MGLKLYKKILTNKLHYLGNLGKLRTPKTGNCSLWRRSERKGQRTEKIKSGLTENYAKLKVRKEMNQKNLRRRLCQNLTKIIMILGN